MRSIKPVNLHGWGGHFPQNWIGSPSQKKASEVKGTVFLLQVIAALQGKQRKKKKKKINTTSGLGLITHLRTSKPGIKEEF